MRRLDAALFPGSLAAFTLNRFLRAIATLVLFISALQIAMCATDCDCFLPAPVGISSHAIPQGDADGCLCCVQCAKMPVPAEVPLLLPQPFVRAWFAPRIFQTDGLSVYRPPRS